MIKAMSFDAFKSNVIALSRRNKAGHLIPDSDTLYRLWELKLTPEQVVRLHCTNEASKLRHEDGKRYTDEELAAVEVARFNLPNARLKALAAKHGPPPEWYAQQEDKPF
jgi:hypothetical protein